MIVPVTTELELEYITLHNTCMHTCQRKQSQMLMTVTVHVVLSELSEQLSGRSRH